MKINLNRRSFIRKTALVTAGAAIIPSAIKAGNNIPAGNPVRLGGPVFGKFDDPVEWVKAVKALRYGAAVCPVTAGSLS